MREELMRWEVDSVVRVSTDLIKIVQLKNVYNVVNMVTKTTKKTHIHHAARHSTMHQQNMGASAAPQTDTGDRGRQSRMDDALAKYNQTHN